MVINYRLFARWGEKLIQRFLFHRLFLVDGIISLPIAVAGFFVLPDVPEIANPWYLSKTVRFYSQLSDKGLVLNDWLYQGGRPRSETHGVRRQKASRAVHRGKTQEDLFLVAYLSPDAVICVCTCGKRTYG